MVPLARVAGTAPCAPAPGCLRHYNRPRRGLHEVHETFSRGSGAEMRPPQLPLLGMAIVRGRSMTPTLYDGDRLLVRHGATPRAGRLAVVRFSDGVVAVKRLDHQTRRRLVGDPGQRHRGPGLLVRQGRSPRTAYSPCVLARLWPRPGHARRAAGRCAKVGPLGHPRPSVANPRPASPWRRVECHRSQPHRISPCRSRRRASSPQGMPFMVASEHMADLGEPSRRRSRLRAARRRQDGDRLPRRPERPGRALDGLHARRGAGVRGDRRGPEPRRRLHLDLRTPLRSSPTAPRCSGSATSARRPRCR